MIRIRPALALCCLALPLVAIAQHHHDHDHDHAHTHEHADQPGAHQHGVGALNLALDGKVLEIELSGPADNFLGFEHAPASEGERQQAQRALKNLREPDGLFILAPEAGCVADSVDIHSALLEDFQAQATEPGSEHKHEHQHATESHQDIAAHYRFRCDNPDALERIQLALFSVFPNTEKLLVQSVGTQGQLGGEVTASQPEVKL